jgi:branched-chain amino acid transport system permease protein
VAELVAYVVSGLSTAGIYAISASGLTLTYATTGVFNFAHGATGMLAAFAYWQLRFEWGWPTLPAILAVVLVGAPLHGLVVERWVMRRMAGSTEVARLVVTVALMLGSIALALWVWDPQVARSVRPLWSGRIVEWGIVRISVNDLVVLALAALVAVGLWALLTRSRQGIAMRARVDDAALTGLCGVSSVRSAQLAWIIGSATAALAGVLIAPKLSMSPIPLTLLIVNAYAASVIGRLRSLPWTFVGALVLGLLNDLGVGYLPKIDTGQQYLRGLVGVTPVAVLFVALLLTAPRRVAEPPPAGTVTPRPTWRGTAELGVGVVAASVVFATVLSAGDLFIATKVWGLALVALSVVPLTGYAGRISLCPLSFGAVGAVAASHVGGGAHPLALPVAGLAAAAVGAVVALPALRLSGIHLALATAAFAVALDRWVFTLPSFTVFGERFTIFDTGSLSMDRPRLGPLRLDDDGPFLVASSVVFVAGLFAVVAVRRSVHGRVLQAMRDSGTACVGLGIDLRRRTLGVFAGSAALAGIGGALYAMGLRSAAADRFSFLTGVTLLLTVCVGGVRAPGSAVLAGVFLGGPTLNRLFPSLTQLTAMTVALGAVSVGANPNGVLVDALRPRWQLVRDRPALALAGVAALVVVWGARVGGAVDTWTWALASLAVVAVLPPVGSLLAHRATRAARDHPGAPSPEWWGLEVPHTPAQGRALDDALALPGPRSLPRPPSPPPAPGPALLAGGHR